MPAYAILIRERVRDTEELKTYSQKAALAREGHDLKALVRYGKVECLEGPPVEGTVILEFPDMAAARAWYDSDAYKAARKHRYLAADYRVFLTEGV